MTEEPLVVARNQQESACFSFQEQLLSRAVPVLGITPKRNCEYSLMTYSLSQVLGASFYVHLKRVTSNINLSAH